MFILHSSFDIIFINFHRPYEQYLLLKSDLFAEILCSGDKYILYILFSEDLMYKWDEERSEIVRILHFHLIVFVCMSAFSMNVN